MENIQETITKLNANWIKIKTNIEKIDAILDDANNCKSDYTKTILISALSKIAESVGIKDILLG